MWRNSKYTIITVQSIAVPQNSSQLGAFLHQGKLLFFLKTVHAYRFDLLSCIHSCNFYFSLWILEQLLTRNFGPSSINLNSKYETSSFFVCLHFCVIAKMELGSTNSPKQKIKPLNQSRSDWIKNCKFHWFLFYLQLGQALSTRPDVLPPVYCQELSKLQVGNFIP